MCHQFPGWGLGADELLEHVQGGEAEEDAGQEEALARRVQHRQGGTTQEVQLRRCNPGGTTLEIKWTLIKCSIWSQIFLYFILIQIHLVQTL